MKCKKLKIINFNQKTRHEDRIAILYGTLCLIINMIEHSD